MALRVRRFRRIFQERSAHAAGLCCVHTASWWDGSTMLHEVTIQRRHDSRHEWPEPEPETTLTTDVFSEATAIRQAVGVHDAVRRVEWMAEDRACAEGDAEEAKP